MALSIKMPELHIGDLVAKIPIVQGGMGVGISLASLASAVAGAGGVGVLSSIGLPILRPLKERTEDALLAVRREIHKAREQARGILGMNVMMASQTFTQEVDIAVEEGVDILFVGAGLPLDLPERLIASAKTKLVPIVSSARAASMLIRRWVERHAYVPDAIVVEGPKAGGHLGFRRDQIDDPAFALEAIVPQVVAETQRAEQQHGKRIPVIAAGGIYSGEDIARMLSLGASGVQMGTRFVATCECDASDAFKQAYVDCTEADIGIIDSPVGMPGRAIVGSFLQGVSEGKHRPKGCPFHCLKTCNPETTPYCISMALIHAQRGNLERGFAFAGQNAYKVTEIVPVRTLLDTLQAEYSEAMDGRDTQ